MWNTLISLITLCLSLWLKALLYMASLPIIRGMLKYLLRRVSGTSEIQRKLIMADHEGVLASIAKSKHLGEFRQYLDQKDHLERAAFKQQVDTLCRIKGIPQTDVMKQRLQTTFGKIYNQKNAYFVLKQFQKKSYDSSVQDYEFKLKQIWGGLQPQGLPYQRITPLWVDIGFQGHDPATDFRGSGILGLENLFYLATRQNQVGRYLVETASTVNREYFMSSAGIFISLKLFQLLESRKLDPRIFQQAVSRKEVLDRFNELYCEVFLKFNEWWKSQKNASMMNFNFLVMEFFQLKYRA